MALPLIIYLTPSRASWNSKIPVTAIRTALVLSSYYMRGTIQVAKDAAVSKADVVSVLVELMV